MRNATETVFSVRTGMFRFVCGVPSHRHGRHFCASGSIRGCDPSQKITLTAPRTAQKAQKDETSTLSSQSLKNLVLLSQRVSRLEDDLATLSSQIDELRSQHGSTAGDLDRRLLRFEHFIEFAERFRLR